MEKEHRYLLRRWVNVTQLSWAVQLSGIKWKPPICWQNICPDWLNTSSSQSVVLRPRSSLKTEENWEPREFATVICASKGRSAEPKALVTLGHARRQALAYVPQGRLLCASAPLKSASARANEEGRFLHNGLRARKDFEGHLEPKVDSNNSVCLWPKTITLGFSKPKWHLSTS